MMDLLLQDGDLAVLNHDFQLCDDHNQAIKQAITIRLKTLAGEWFLDTRLGLPYLTQILGQKKKTRLLERLIKDELQSLADIKTIIDFDYELQPERCLVLKFKAILTDQSIIPFNERLGAIK